MRNDAGGREAAATLSVVLVPVVIVVAGLFGFLGVWEELVQGIGGRDDPDNLNGYLVTAVAVGVVGPMAGIVLAGGQAVRVVHGVIPAATILLVVTAAVEAGANGPVPEEPRPAPGCQEYSGGDSTCPGG